MAAIWRTRDRQGREVVLTAAGWGHIVAEHGDVAVTWAEVRSTVELLGRVMVGPRFADRECHYRLADSWGLSFKVVIGYRLMLPSGTLIGEVVTAYRTHRVKLEERQLWP